jgi:hypothetical protein
LFLSLTACARARIEEEMQICLTGARTPMQAGGEISKSEWACGQPCRKASSIHFRTRYGVAMGARKDGQLRVRRQCGQPSERTRSRSGGHGNAPAANSSWGQLKKVDHRNGTGPILSRRQPRQLLATQSPLLGSMSARPLQTTLLRLEWSRTE